MNVAMLVSVSDGISDIAALTMPNKLAYCLRHGYSLVADYQPYDQAIANTHWLCHYLDRFDLVWALDADAIVTDMSVAVHELDCLGPHVTACEEGIVDWNDINCGSVIYRNTPETRGLLVDIATLRDEWVSLPCQWQTWLGCQRSVLGDVLTVAPLRSFNSCVWNRPANARDEVGGHWRPGDFVYHACGVYPLQERYEWLTRALHEVRN